jgi:hypothetical protein
MAKRVLINFESNERERARFKRAAAVERMSLSAWLRRLALVRLSELADRIEAEGQEA